MSVVAYQIVKIKEKGYTETHPQVHAVLGRCVSMFVSVYWIFDLTKSDKNLKIKIEI